MGEEIIDLDVIRPDKQIVVIAGKEIDTSIISFGIVLELIDKIEDMGDATGDRKSTKKMMSVFGEIIDKILKESDPSIDDKWIRKHIGGFQKMILIEKIVTPMLDEVTNTTGAKKKKSKV